MILDDHHNSIWESFKNPTDTILPGQTLHIDTRLRSCQSLKNYSEGRFQLSLQLDGNLFLYSMSNQIHEKAYFATMTMNWASQLIFTEAGYMFINGGNNLIHHLTMKDPGPNESFYHMARINYDGIFILYSHAIREDTTGCGSCSSLWTEVQRIPDDICGKGLCGPNSICNITDNRMAFCTCPL